MTLLGPNFLKIYQWWSNQSKVILRENESYETFKWTPRKIPKMELSFWKSCSFSLKHYWRRVRLLVFHESFLHFFQTTFIRSVYKQVIQVRIPNNDPPETVSEAWRLWRSIKDCDKIGIALSLISGPNCTS